VSQRVVVTGAFSYTGAAVARELMGRGHTVHTLTNRRPPTAGGAVTSAPLRFDRDHLTRELAGADALVSTYWIRLPHAGQTFATAVDNGRLLVDAATRAGIRRLVQVSVINAAAGSRLGYFTAKARGEDIVRGSGLSYALVRPTMVVGPGDVLSNNIAWFLRRSPLFPVPDGGAYRVQPVTLADTARIIADAMEERGNVELDAAGPEVFAFADYIRLLAEACGVRRRIVSSPGWLALACLRVAGWFLADVVLAAEELRCLQEELILSRAPPLGRDSVAAWLRAHGEDLGRRYVNDRRRHFGGGRTEPVLDPATLGAGS